MKNFRFIEFPYKDIPEAVWGAWMSLARKWHAQAFRVPTWVRDQPWMVESVPYARLLVGTDERNDYLGFWPYQVVSTRIRGILPIRFCCPWGGEKHIDPGVSTRSRFWALCTPNPPPGFVTAFVESFMERTRWDMLQTGDLGKPSSLLDAWEEALKQKRLRYWKKQHESAVICPLDSFESYLASLSQKWRHQYRSLQKRYVESGMIRVEQWSAFPGDALDRAIERIRAIYLDSWKASSEVVAVNLALASTFAAFSARIAAFAREGGLHIVFITVDGDDAAFDVGVSHGDMYCELQTAYREKYASHGVGFLALMESNRYTIGKRIRERNLLGYEDYKRHFGARVMHSMSYTVFSRDAIGRLAWCIKSVRSSLGRVRRTWSTRLTV